MTVVRVVVGWSAAVVLVALGVGGILATHSAWVPCAGDHTDPLCLRAMDAPGNSEILFFSWWVAAAVTLAATVVARGSTARTVAASAMLLVLVMNPVTEYGLWVTLAGGHWDVPPGAGYTQSASMVAAGLLVAVSAVLGQRAAQHPPGDAGSNAGETTKPRHLASSA